MPEESKGLPQNLNRVPRASNGLSDFAVDCRAYNGVRVVVLVSGTSAQATIGMEGSNETGGDYRLLEVPNALHVRVSQSFSFTCSAPANFVKARLSDVSGTFGANQGFTIIVTPIGNELPDVAFRTQGYLLRDSVTTADLVAEPPTPTITSISMSGGTLSASTLYYVGVANLTLQAGSGAILGITTTATKSLTTSVGHNGIKVALGTTDADGYLVFLSTDVAPKLAAYVSQAELDDAIGGVKCVSEFVVTTGGSQSGRIDMGVVGTGLQTSNAIFAQNCAHLLDSLSTLDCRGRSKVLLTVRAKLSKTSTWSAAPSLTLLPWIKTQESSADWARKAAITPTYLAAVSDSMTTEHEINVDGATELTVSLAAMAGLGSVDVWAELK